MPKTNNLNARLALCKGWRYMVHDVQKGIVVCPVHPELPPEHPGLAYWYDPQNRHCPLHDWVGTLEGVARLAIELQDRENATSHNWLIRWSTFLQIWDVWKEDENTHERLAEFLSTKEEIFGIAVGDAWLSEFEKEDADAS